MSDGQEIGDEYKVVHNDEEQYSIWSADRPVPPGWHEEGFAGSQQACLAHIDEVWTDMRPLSLRRRMAAGDGRGGADIARGAVS